MTRTRASRLCSAVVAAGLALGVTAVAAGTASAAPKPKGAPVVVVDDGTGTDGGSLYGGSLYGGSLYGGSLYGGSLYGGTAG